MSSLSPNSHILPPLHDIDEWTRTFFKSCQTEHYDVLLKKRSTLLLRPRVTAYLSNNNKSQLELATDVREYLMIDTEIKQREKKVNELKDDEKQKLNIVGQKRGPDNIIAGLVSKSGIVRTTRHSYADGIVNSKEIRQKQLKQFAECELKFKHKMNVLRKHNVFPEKDTVSAYCVNDFLTQYPYFIGRCFMFYDSKQERYMLKITQSLLELMDIDDSYDVYKEEYYMGVEIHGKNYCHECIIHNDEYGLDECDHIIAKRIADNKDRTEI